MSAENPLDRGAIGSYLKGAIDNIINCSFATEFGELAEVSRQKIISGKLFVTEGDRTQPGATSFELKKIKAGGPLFPCVVLDGSKLKFTSLTDIAADLIRTLIISEQYPLRGFQRRLGEVYRYGLRAQAQWLRKEGIDSIPLDPRCENQESLVKKLLGDEKYYADLGFEDLQLAIDGYSLGQGVEIVKRLSRLRESPMSFINARNELSNRPGQVRLDLGTDERATDNAFKMLQSFVHSGVNLN